MFTLYIETHSRSSHLLFSVSPTKKAISCIHSLQTHGLLKVKLFTKNCERRRPASMFCDCSKRNAILELLFRSRKGLCLDYGDQWYPLRNCNVLLEQKKREIKRQSPQHYFFMEPCLYPHLSAQYSVPRSPYSLIPLFSACGAVALIPLSNLRRFISNSLQTHQVLTVLIAFLISLPIQLPFRKLIYFLETFA